jgi:hypothetical protein
MTKRVHEVKWFKENGFFSEDGDHAMMHFRDGLNDLMFKDEIHEMSVAQLQTLKSNLYKMVGDAISEALASKRALAAKFAAMSDKEFYAYLDDKHGDFWPIVNGGLSREEEDRLPTSKLRELEANKPQVKSFVKKK